MKFRVKRGWIETLPPCDEAVYVPSYRVDRRTSVSPEEFDEKGLRPGPWLEHGYDHTTWRDTGPRRSGGIERKFPDAVWVVDVPDLTALATLAERYFGVTLERDESYPEFLTIDLQHECE